MVSSFKSWWIASRPWSFTASLVPVFLGGVLSLESMPSPINIPYHLTIFLFTFVGAVCLQAGTNYLNTYGDYISGVDTVESAKTCPQLVTGLFKKEQMRLAGVIMLVVASLIGVGFFFVSGWPILVFGGIGVLGVATYTTGCAPYKYKGLGPLFVFFLMGPGMVVPSYYMQTGMVEWEPFFIAFPVGFLVTAILHANDLRDIDHDSASGIKTMAMKLGLQQSLYVYKALIFCAYSSILVLIAYGVVFYSAALPFVLIPMVVKEFNRLKLQGHVEPLEMWTAQFHFLFGMLFVVGIFLGIVFN